MRAAVYASLGLAVLNIWLGIIFGCAWLVTRNDANATASTWFWCLAIAAAALFFFTAGRDDDEGRPA